VSHPFVGSGPGAQAPDGCSVDVYRALPYLGELNDVLPLLPAGTSVLELGCGTGRLAVEMARAGCKVTGVDESAEMLVQVPPAVRTVRSSIEALNLSTAFDAVLLASHLINHPHAQTRAAFVACARRHLSVGGRLILQRHDPDWLLAAQPGPLGRIADLELAAEFVRRDGALVGMTLCYTRGDHRWRHSFSAQALSTADVGRLLGAHGFGAVRWIDARRLWACAQSQ
jgi:SAM-dependent methyltransferase